MGGQIIGRNSQGLNVRAQIEAMRAAQAAAQQAARQNQGAWFFVQHYIHENMASGQRLGYAGRAASASPAVGYAHLHQDQQKALIDAAFGRLKGFVLQK